MQYCSQCGTAISTQAQFCPSCGWEVTLKSKVESKIEEKIPKMEKGVTKSLENKTQQYVENQVRKSIDQIISKPTAELDEVLKNQNPKPTIHSDTLSDHKTSIQNETRSGSNVHNMIWIYAGLQILLGYLGYKTPEILLISLVSIFVFIVVWMQKNLPKPFNWIVKSLLVFQMLIYTLLVMRWYEFLFQSRLAILIIILFFVNFILLFKGNKN